MLKTRTFLALKISKFTLFDHISLQLQRVMVDTQAVIQSTHQLKSSTLL